MNSTAKMKFRRFLYRTLRLLFITVCLISGIRLTDYINEQRREKKDAAERERKRGETVRLLVTCFCSAAAAVAGTIIALRTVRRRRGGYLIDLFDRDEYDVVEPDKEEEVESKIRAELRGNDDSSAKRRARTPIPVDEGSDDLGL